MQKTNTWNAKCPIFLGNFTPKTSNFCLKNRALGFPGIYQSPPPQKKVQQHFQFQPSGLQVFHLANTELFQTLKGAQGATPPLQIVPRIDEMAT